MISEVRSLPIKSSKPSLINFIQPTRNIAAVESGGKNYVFYVNSDHKLCYLLSPSGRDNNDFDQKTITIPDVDLKIKCGSEQIAAVAWEGKASKEVGPLFLMRSPD
jgi:thiamine kinase-like enzyme